jgi:hypothetical protein
MSSCELTLDNPAQPPYRRLRWLEQTQPIRLDQGGRIAQLVEQLTLNQRVVGSNPTAPTNEIKELCSVSIWFPFLNNRPTTTENRC